MSEVAIVEPTTITPTPQLPAVADQHGKAVEKAERKPRKPRETESIVNIATAIAAITSECGVVAKLGVNKFHNYKFAAMQDVLQKLTPLIAKHGLVIVQTEVSRNMLDDGRAVAVEYEFTIAHTSGEMWPDRPKQTGLCRCRDSKGGFDDKAFNKAHTAARKYFLLALFQIATGEEDDADTHDTRRHEPIRSAPRPPAANVMLEPPIDPETGEYLAPVPHDEPSQWDEARPAADPGPSTPGAPMEGAGALSIEDMAREAAKRGEKLFAAFYKKRTKAEQGQINLIGDELRGLMPRTA